MRTFKLIGTCFLIVLILFATPISVGANDAAGDEAAGGGLFSRLIGFVVDTFRYVIEDIIEPLTGLRALNNLVFADDLLYFTFTENEWNLIVKKGMQLTIGLAYTFLFIGVLNLSFMTSKVAFNPQTRTSFIELIGALLFVAFMLRNLETLYIMMLTFNQFLVNVFRSAIEAGENLDFGDLSGSLGALFLYMVYLGLSLWANIYYLMRKFTIMALFILGPVFITVFLFPQFRAITGAWLRETFASIMVQGIHACLLWIFLMMDDSVTENWITKMVLLATFIPISEGIKQLFSLSDGMTSRGATMATFAGAAAMTQMYSATQSAFGKRSLNDQVSSRYGVSDNQNRSRVGDRQGGPGGNSSRDSLNEAAPMHRRSANLQKVGRITGNIGKGMGTLLGSAAGLPFGPAGVVAGGMMGGKAGELAGGTTGRMAWAGVSAGAAVGSNVVKSMDDEIKNTNFNEMDTPSSRYARAYQTTEAAVVGAGKGLKNTFGIDRNLSPAEAKKLSVQRANYIGTAIGGEGGGRALGQWVNSRSRYNKPIQEQGMEVSDLQTSGIRKVRVAVSNEASTVMGYMPDGSEQRLTQYKGGDSSLKDGEIIFKDYQVQDGRLVDNGRFESGNGFYREDSKGGKQYIDHQYQVNPHTYFENKTQGSEKYFKPDRFKQGIV